MIRPLIRISISLRRRISSRPVAASARAAQQQHVVRLMLAQHVVDEIGREQHLPPRLLLAGEAPRDQPGDAPRRCRNVRFISADSASHASRSSPSMSGDRTAHRDRARPLPDHRRHVAERPHRQRIFIGDEAERLRARRAPAAGSAACRASDARAGLRTDSRRDSACRRAGRSRPRVRAAPARARTRPANDSHSRTWSGRPFHARGSASSMAHALGQIGRERKLAARRRTAPWRSSSLAARDVDLVLHQGLVTHDLAAEHEGVARHAVPR